MVKEKENDDEKIIKKDVSEIDENIKKRREKILMIKKK